MKKIVWSVSFLILFIYGCNGQSGRKRPLPIVPAIKHPTATLQKPSYNIFMENSGSMNGYVQSQAEFKETVGNFLTDIEINSLSKSINLNYINSTIIPIGSNIPSFINNLNPTSFISAGGKITTTDVSKMLKSILSRTEDNSVSIFISDCVFSPPKQVPAQLYLVNQQLETKTNFANKLNSLNFTTVVLRLTARFNGIYFNCANLTTKINAQRPYYIWIMGKHEYIKNLFEKIDYQKFKGGGVKNYYCLNNCLINSNFSILGSLNFQRDKTDPLHKIINARKITVGPHSGEFQISFGINLKDALIDDDYILENANYTIPSNYTIEIKNSTITGYTHILTLTTKTLKPQNLNIKLENKRPNWIIQANSDDDTHILIGNEMNKTFGIKNLIDGIFEAYLAKTPGGPNKPIFEFEISIN